MRLYQAAAMLASAATMAVAAPVDTPVGLSDVDSTLDPVLYDTYDGSAEILPADTVDGSFVERRAPSGALVARSNMYTGGFQYPNLNCGDALAPGSTDAPFIKDCLDANYLWSDRPSYYPEWGRITQTSGTCVLAWHPWWGVTWMSVSNQEIRNEFANLLGNCLTGASMEYIQNYAYSSGQKGVYSAYKYGDAEDGSDTPAQLPAGWTGR